MKSSEALKAVRAAKVATIGVDPDLLTFGGWSLVDIVELLNAAELVKGSGPSYVVRADGYLLTVIIANSSLTVIGIGKG